jgi:hypothetical protein
LRAWGKPSPQIVQANRRELDVVRKIGDVVTAAEISMPHLAVRALPFSRHLGVSPRTLAHLESSLASVDTELSGDVLDALDDIVALGTDVGSEDNYFADEPALADASQRRTMTPAIDAMRSSSSWSVIDDAGRQHGGVRAGTRGQRWLSVSSGLAGPARATRSPTNALSRPTDGSRVATRVDPVHDRAP